MLLARQASRDSDASPGPGIRASSAAREEERRKVLEIEEEQRLRREREVQLRRGNVTSGPGISRANSRASRTTANTATVIPGAPRSRSRGGGVLPQDEIDSQFSGHSSSSALRPATEGGGVPKLSRYDQHRIASRGVRRSASNANRVIGNKKIPGSVTSSLNSSESETAAAAAAAAANANRSVYLHSACVADIPPKAESAAALAAKRRALSAESRLVSYLIKNRLFQPQLCDIKQLH